MSIFSDKRNSNLRSAALVGFLTFLSRVTGMLQSRLVASYLGVGFAADAFMVAFRIPNLLRRFTAEGTMTSALILTLNEVEAQQGVSAGKDLVAKFLGTLSVILTIATLLAVPTMSLFVGLQVLGRIAPGLHWWQQLTLLGKILIGKASNPQELVLTTKLARIMFPYLILVSLTAGCSAVLNLRKQFGLPASASTIWNLTFIGFAFLGLNLAAAQATQERIAAYLSLAAIIGGLAQLLVVWPAFYRLGFKVKFGFYWQHIEVRRVIKRMLPGLLGTGIHPINVVISTMLASQLAVGAQTVLFNANMMGEMVLGIFATSLATVSLPAMSKLVVSGDIPGLRENLVTTIRYTALLILPGAIGMAILAWPIIAVIFHTGHYDLRAVAWTASTLKYQAFGLLFIATNRIIMQCLYALGDYKKPVYVALLGMLTNILLSILLMKPLGTSGIALANGLSSLVNLGFLVFIVNRYVVGIPWVRVVTCWLLSGIASGAMGVLAYFGANNLKLNIVTNTFSMCLRLLPLIGFCALAYLLFLVMLFVPEARIFGNLITSRINTLLLRFK